MKKIVMMGRRKPEIIGNGEFHVTYFDPTEFVPSDLLFSDDYLAMHNLDERWRVNDSQLMKLLSKLEHLSCESDALLVNWVNPLPPEWVYLRLAGVKKYFGCMDDPHKSYDRTINSLWAYDGAFYWSPSYDDYYSMKEVLHLWGAKRSYWWPASWNRDFLTDAFISRVTNSIDNRTSVVTYVGKLYGSKYDRLVNIKRSFGKDFAIYGSWPYRGFVGYAAPLRGRKFMPYKVNSLTDVQREDIYLKTKIGLNMHLSDTPREFGNLRTYEIPLHGMMLLSDKGAGSSYESVFIPGEEAVYYENLDHAIELISYYSRAEEERQRIAMRGFLRACKDYHPENNLVNLFRWATK